LAANVQTLPPFVVRIQRDRPMAAVKTMAPSLGIELTPVNVIDMGEIERSVAAFARTPNGGVIVTGSSRAVLHRKPIVALAAQ
jgi:putative tryptophan/tyrosine transport system substrate-binding protein